MSIRLAILLPLALAAVACGSAKQKYEGTAPEMVEFKEQEKVPGKSVSRIEEPDKVPALAVELDPSGRFGSKRLRDDLAAGRNWLILLRPIGFSYAGSELISGRTLFKPTKAEFTYAQRDGSGSGEKLELAPVLLRLAGDVTNVDSARLLKEVPDPGIDILGLGEVKNRNMRVLLGRGIDNSLGMAGQDQGGTGSMDTREWIAVVDREGKEIKDWEQVLAASIREGNFDRIWELEVLTRRWRPSANPPATYFKVPFPLILACSHMKVTAKGDDFHWTWEGIWAGELRRAPAAGVAQPLEGAPPSTVLYKEYKGQRGKSATFWRTLLSPVALGVDFGASVFDSLVDTDRRANVFERTTEKQKARED